MWLLQVAVEDILSQHFVHPLERLAMLTAGYAGSDIRDVVHHGLPQDDLAPMVTFDSLLGGLAKVCGLPGMSGSVCKHCYCTGYTDAGVAPG